jgi:hypothetical protein
MDSESALGWHGPVLAFGVAILTCYGKTISLQQNFDGLHVRDIAWDRRGRTGEKGETLGMRVASRARCTRRAVERLEYFFTTC